MEEPKTVGITALITSYNEIHYIKDAIKSIVRQVYRPIELLIVDDGSVDDTVNYLKTLKFSDLDFKLLQFKENMGRIIALNTGIEAAKYDLIAILDADDIAYPDRFSKQIEFLEENKDCVLVGCNYDFLNSKGEKIGISKKLQMQNPPYFDPLVDPNIPHTGVVYRKEAVISVGCYRNFQQAEDYDLFLRLSDHYKLGIVEDILTGVRIKEHGLTSTGFELQRKVWMYVKEDTIRRRQNLTRIQFDEWLQLNKSKLESKQRKWKAQEELRNLGSYIMTKNYFKAFISFNKAFFYDPKTVIEKVKSYSLS